MTDTTYTLPKSLRELIAQWMTDNQGWRTSTDIIAGLRRNDPGPAAADASIHKELARMSRAGELLRCKTTLPGSTSQRTFYLLVPLTS